MCLRWTAAGMLEAERQFRRIIGYHDLAKLADAVERDLQHAHRELTAHPPLGADRGGRYARRRLNFTPGPPPQGSTATGTSSAFGAFTLVWGGVD
jgi:hypothetical protein